MGKRKKNRRPIARQSRWADDCIQGKLRTQHLVELRTLDEPVFLPDNKPPEYSPNKREDAKAMKLPKRFASDFINTSRGVDKSLTEAYDIYNNHQRVLSTTGRKDQMMPVKDNTFLQPIPKTKSLSVRATDVNDNPVFDKDGRAVFIPTPKRIAKEGAKTEYVLGLKEFWSHTIEIKEGVVQTRVREGRISGFCDWNYYHIKEHSRENDKLLLYFSMERWIFVRLFPDCFWFSNTYKSKEEAMNRCNRGVIFWAGERKYRVVSAD